MQKSDSTNELAAALVRVQVAIQPAIKDSINPAFKSKYADLGAIWDACRELLAKNGLSVVQMPAPAEPGMAALETLLMHTSGQFVSNYAQVRLVRDDAQGAGSAYTYLRRYSLSAFIGIVADIDDDGNAASQKPAQQSSYQPRQEQAQLQQRQRTETPPPAARTAATAKTQEPAFVLAARAYFDQYETVVGGRTWKHAAAFLQSNGESPKTVEGWKRVTEATADKIKRQQQRADGTAFDAIEAEYDAIEAAEAARN